MQSLKIIGACVVAAVLYGMIHDQITARICLEYFTVFHPPILGGSLSPTMLAFAWGIIATWWVGLFLGVALAIAARAGNRPTLSAGELVPMIGTLLVAMACCAFISGVIGFSWGKLPPELEQLLAPALRRRFLADWWAHSASYASGLVGGVVLSVMAYLKRGSKQGPIQPKPRIINGKQSSPA